MKSADLLELPTVPQRIDAAWIRLIPLSQPGRFEALPVELQAFVLVCGAFMEVQSGGVEGWRGSSLARLPLPLPEALAEVGAPDVVADLFARLEAEEPSGLAALEEALHAQRDVVLGMLLDHLRASPEALATLDPWPSGMKALPFPPEATAKGACAEEPFDPFVVVTLALMEGRKGRPATSPPCDAALELLDAVSQGGPLTWWFTRDADREVEAKAQLTAAKATSLLTLLASAERAAGTPPPGETTARRAWLDALSDDAHEALRELANEFQAQRTEAFEAMAAWIRAHLAA